MHYNQFLSVLLRVLAVAAAVVAILLSISFIMKFLRCLYVTWMSSAAVPPSPSPPPPSVAVSSSGGPSATSSFASNGAMAGSLAGSNYTGSARSSSVTSWSEVDAAGSPESGFLSGNSDEIVPAAN
jgi:hypothetical protein